MGQYETFVIRLWIEDDSRQGHGEVRHLATGRGLMFQQIEEAIRFVERIAAHQRSDDDLDGHLDELGPARRLIDLEPHQRKGGHGR